MSAELLAEVTRNIRSHTRVDTIDWLVDNACAYSAVLQAVNAAQHSIWMSQLAFDADCLAYDDTERTVDERGQRLIDALMAASKQRGVEVRILLNASLLLDTAAPLRSFLKTNGAGSIHVRGIRRFPQLLHAKFIVVDGHRAFLIGSPFANGYWDDSQHHPVDQRRPARELGGRPIHDVSCAITGPAVDALECYFAELWNDVSVSPQECCRIPAASFAKTAGAIRAVRTAPRRVLASHPAGCTEILTEMVGALSTARSLVYIEHQYLSSRAIVHALVAALERQPTLEVIVVLNQNPDVTAYRGWQNARIRESGLLDHPRVGLFALWTMSPAAGGMRPAVSQIFVHSKVVAIDDVWATVGSANLDGVSLHSYGDDFESQPCRRVFRHVRNFDVNLVLDDRDNALCGAVRELRTRLWSEHLALDEQELITRPAGGWLARWRAIASRNVAAFSGDDDTQLSGGFVLPYSTGATPRKQLAELGISSNAVNICFDPGWLEVHCSPNWVRNMFE